MAVLRKYKSLFGLPTYSSVLGAWWYNGSLLLCQNRLALGTLRDVTTPPTCPGRSPTCWGSSAWSGPATGEPSKSATQRTVSPRDVAPQSCAWLEPTTSTFSCCIVFFFFLDPWSSARRGGSGWRFGSKNCWRFELLSKSTACCSAWCTDSQVPVRFFQIHLKWSRTRNLKFFLFFVWWLTKSWKPWLDLVFLNYWLTLWHPLFLLLSRAKRDDRFARFTTMLCNPESCFAASWTPAHSYSIVPALLACVLIVLLYNFSA